MTRNIFSDIPDFSLPARDLIRESRAARRSAEIEITKDTTHLLNALGRMATVTSLTEAQAIAREALRQAGGRM